MMMKTTIVCGLLVMGCGGGGEDAREPTAPLIDPVQEPVEPAGMPEEGTDSTVSAGEVAPPIEGAMVAPEPVEAPMARAELKTIPGDAPVGTLMFEQQGTQISITGQFAGLKAGEHALYIHENGDCSNSGKKVGRHFNPTGARHGPASSAERHAGDFGNLTVEEGGDGAFAMTTDSVTIMAEGPDIVVGKAVVIYAGKDTMSGKAGKPIACGVISLGEPLEVTPKGSR